MRDPAAFTSADEISGVLQALMKSLANPIEAPPSEPPGSIPDSVGGIAALLPQPIDTPPDRAETAYQDMGSAADAFFRSDPSPAPRSAADPTSPSTPRRSDIEVAPQSIQTFPNLVYAPAPDVRAATQRPPTEQPSDSVAAPDVIPPLAEPMTSVDPRSSVSSTDAGPTSMVFVDQRGSASDLGSSTVPMSGPVTTSTGPEPGASSSSRDRLAIRDNPGGIAASLSVGGLHGPSTDGPPNPGVNRSVWGDEPVDFGQRSLNGPSEAIGVGRGDQAMGRTNELLGQILDELRRFSQAPLVGSARAVYPER